MKQDFPDQKRISPTFPRQTWKSYQEELRRQAAPKKRLRDFFRLFAILCVFFSVLYGISVSIDGFSSTPKDPLDLKSSLTQSDPSNAENAIAKSAFQLDSLSAFFEGRDPLKNSQDQWMIHKEGNRFRVKSSLDSDLQGYLNQKMDRKSPKQVAIVIVEPTTGRIIAMSGNDRMDPSNNPCIDGEFPAASIFKIVTASAAVEKHGFQPDTAFVYNGRKHTLYRSQLKNQQNKYSHRVTLRDSFAQSVNPVFGKIGIYHLDMPQIKKTARAFGFEEEIAFELGKTQSRLFISEEPYHVAEIASGFNRNTTLSPLHGALIAATILNGGNLMAPSFVDRITNGSGELIYKAKPNEVRRVISTETASVIYNIMQATIRSGTSRKAFRGYRYDKVLSRLVIGGKTGSISDLSQTSKYDWFVGFAKEKEGTESIAVSVLVVHDKVMTRRAGSYARMAMKAYYESYFNGKGTDPKKTQRS